MSKNTNLSFLTDYITADITNGRIGINNASPTVAFDVTGVAKFSSNVGINVTPSAWASGTENVLQVKSASIYEYGGYETALSVNAYYNAGWKYIGSNTASQLQLSAGALSFKSAITGTAGNAITWATPLTITSAGNVGIGTSSPLDTYAGRTVLTINNNGAYGAFLNFGYNGTLYGSIEQGTAELKIANYQNIPTIFYTNSAERMRIPSTGGLLVGTTTSPTITGGQIIVLGDTIFCSGTFNVPSPYTQSLRIDIVWNNWGGNNVAAIVEVDIVAREWGNLGGIAFGKVYALSSAGAATFNNTVNTTNITSANGSFSLSSPANYTLRLNFTPTNNKDIMGYLIKIPASTAGTGTNVASITASLV